MRGMGAVEAQALAQELAIRHATPIERLPGQIQETERKLARLKRLEELLSKNEELREALDIIFEGGLL